MTSLTGSRALLAHNVASRISISALVKTALYGELEDAKYAYILDSLLADLFFSWGHVLEATGFVSLPGLPSSTGALAPSIRVMIDPIKVNVTFFLLSDGKFSLPSGNCRETD